MEAVCVCVSDEGCVCVYQMKAVFVCIKWRLCVYQMKVVCVCVK